ncbi:Cytochrome P450 3A9 [Smittium culicis]|uniref:Cytochrome P450 3A9 n=1 Tax=Smittium culicis TaxID=133412 RepID=A0A1R1YN13_9FUNG|nr:Cytochrome P450 3A9 [Smittium culicis]
MFFKTILVLLIKAPKQISVANPRDFKKITSTYKFPKSGAYDDLAVSQQNIFSTNSEDFNRMRRRQIGPAFTQTGLDQVEDIVLQYEESICIRKQEFEQNDIHGIPDILQMYLNSINTTNNKKLSREELVSETLVMLIGGTGSTSLTMTHLLHLYTLYPDIYKRVTDEVRSKFPDRSKIIKYQEAKENLPFLTSTIYESLRLMPVVAGLLSRENNFENLELSGIKIPKGTVINLYIEGANKNPDFWESPDSFNPDRFMGSKGETLRKEVATFSHGVRICPGRNLAWFEMLTVMSNLLRDYDFQLIEGSNYSPSNLDPGRNYEPKLYDTESTLVLSPSYPERDCNIQFFRSNF